MELQREDCKYWPYYCEENIWHLVQNPVLKDLTKTVVFISNLNTTCLMHHQRAGLLGTVVWDYHVILMADEFVFDLDTSLNFPCLKKTYLAKTFEEPIDARFKPMFKLVPSQRYLFEFSSDRSHMLNEDGHYAQPLPNWPCINPEKSHNLHRFINMSDHEFGSIYTLEGIIDENTL